MAGTSRSSIKDFLSSVVNGTGSLLFPSIRLLEQFFQCWASEFDVKPVRQQSL